MPRNPSPQQTYYAALVPQLAEPLCHYDWQFRGFNRWIKTALAPLIEDEDDETTAEDARAHFIPDGFFADPETKRLYVLEVVETNDVDDRKAAVISDCFWLVDRSLEWQFEAVVLFYPKYARTMLVSDLYAIDGYAARFEGRKTPYRDAFTVLRYGAPKRKAA